MAPGPHVVMVAGEASGDMHGARLAQALKDALPGLSISGVGGARMAASGVDILYPAEELSLVGFTGVIPKLRVILEALRGLRRHMAKTRPDLVILVDFPDFNFRVGKAAHKLGLKVLYYICPQIWAWRRGRAAKMARFVDLLAVTFPFEPDILTQIAPQLNSVFVGHPLLDAAQDRAPDLNGVPVPDDGALVGLLPGSRMSEVSRIMPLLLASAIEMRKKRDDLHFVLPLAPGLKRESLEPYLKGAPPGLTVIPARAQGVMAKARLLLVASGTATLEAALAGAPMVVVYKTTAVNYLVARALVKVDHIAMPNLIAGRRVVPELVQGEAKPKVVAAEALKLLDEGPTRSGMLAGLAEIKKRMGGPGATQKVADLALELIKGT